MPECCDVCGFAWDSITADELPSRLRKAAEGFGAVLGRGGDALSRRTAPDVWSRVEYGCHVRDAMFNLRDRIVLGVAEDNPTPHAMHTDVRIAEGLYAGDQPKVLAVEIAVAADLLARTIETLDAEHLARPIFYGWPRPATRTLLWVGAQALHEAEHHLDDVR
jgi:DNA segregation ATPase FtsK/SpoIIIE, S-DNA-T family